MLNDIFLFQISGSLSTFSNVNVIANPSYEGPSVRTPSPRSQMGPIDDMRGHLV